MQRYRILYANGPGDVIQAYRDWKSGQATISETSLTFSGQTFGRAKVELWAISSHSRSELVVDGQFRIENRPLRPSGKVYGRSLSTQLADMMGGRVVVDNDSGDGSTERFSSTVVAFSIA